jgi:hypothetical protein
MKPAGNGLEGVFIMTRSDQRRAPVLGALLLGCLSVWGTGCKKEQPQTSAPVDAGVVVAVVDAGVRAPGPGAKVVKPLRLSDVVLARTGDRVAVTYTLTNPGTAQGRGDACLSLHDEQGAAIEVKRLGGITVKGGTTDTFEDTANLGSPSWKQARTLMLYTAPEFRCGSGAPVATSELLRLLPTGEPAHANTPAPLVPVDARAADFEVSHVKVSQAGSSDDYSVTYTVKNLSDHRATGSGCLRAYVKGGDRHLEESPVGDFSLAPGASETVTDSVVFENDKHWDEVTELRVFSSPYGCADEADSDNVGLQLAKPADVHAPVEDLEAESSEDEAHVTDMDASDDDTPEPAGDGDREPPETEGN